MMSQVVEEFFNSCHSPTTGRFCGTHNTGPTRDGSVPLGRKYKITGDKKKDTLAIYQLDRGSPERKAARQAFEKHYGGGAKPGQSGGIGGGSAGAKAGKPLASKPNPVAKAKRTRHNVGPTKDGSQPLGRKFKITGNKVKDHLDLLQLDRGSPERKEASRLWNKRYG